GVAGNAGQGTYSAANAFLAALAITRRAQGLPAVSIAWGLWDTASGMTGTLTDTDRARLARAGIAPMSVDEGLAMFDAALTSEDPLLVAARWDAAGLRARAGNGDLPGILRGLVRVPRRPAGNPQGSLAARLAELGREEALRLVTDTVRDHVAAVLAHGHAEKVGLDRAFNQLVFDHPTVRVLAEHLFETLAPAPASPEDMLRGALEHVGAMLTSAKDDSEVIRGKLVAVLKSGLARFGTEPEKPDTVVDKIDDAT